MLNVDIDTILISLVVILIVVVIARIAIQRYRLSRQQQQVLPVSNTTDKNILDTNNNEVKNDIVKTEKTDNKENSLISDNKDIKELEKEQEKELEKETTSKIDIINNLSSVKVVNNIKEEIKEIKEEKVNIKTENKSDSEINIGELDNDGELDYQQLITDPISIFTNNKLPSKHRIAAIREAGQQKMEKAVPELIKALYDPDVSISLVAAESLGMIGDFRAIEPLMDISKQNDEELCKAAEEYMGGALVVPGDEQIFNYKKDTEMEKEKDAPLNYKEMVVAKVEQLPLDYFQPDGCPIPRKELVIKGLNDDNEQMRQVAVKAAIGIDESEEIVEPLTKALTNPAESEAIRAMAAEALGGMRSSKSINTLLRALTDDNVAVRYAAATALNGHSESKVIEALIKATRDTNKYVRASAAYALGTSGSEIALRALIICAEDENEVVRFSAVKAISSFNFDTVFKKLVEERIGLERKSQILAKIEILSQFREPRVVDILKGYLSDLDSEITYKASMALMGQENPEVIDELIEASHRLDQELYSIAKEKIDPEVFIEITRFNPDSNSGKNAFKFSKSESKLFATKKHSFVNKDKKQLKNEESLVDDEKGIIESYNLEESNNKQNQINDTLSVFGVKKDYSKENNSDFEKEQIVHKELSDDEDLSLEEIKGLPFEFEKIRRALLSDSSNERAKAAITLGNYKGKAESLKLLRATLRDKNESVRVAAINSLGRIANTEAFNLIITCEKDLSTEVRYAVVKALSEIQDYSAAEVLKRMSVNDISIDIKRNARIALKKYNLI